MKAKFDKNGCIIIKGESIAECLLLEKMGFERSIDGVLDLRGIIILDYNMEELTDNE